MRSHGRLKAVTVGRYGRPVLLAGLIFAGLVLVGCTAPAEISRMQPQPPTSSPSPTYATVERPSQFDLINTVRLAPADTTNPGILSDFTYYTMDANANVLGIDVRTGQTIWDSPLTSTDPPPANVWTCLSQVADAETVYTIASNYQNADAPVQVMLTAINQATGNVLWRYSPPTTQPPVATECGGALGYTITPTSHGLLLSVSEMVDDSPTTYSEMLDAASGSVIWHSDTAVYATSSAVYGIALTSPVDAADAVLIDLTTGVTGATIATAEPGAVWPSYSVLGLIDGDLIIMQQALAITFDPKDPVGTTTTNTSIFRVSATTGLLPPKSTIQLADNDLDACLLATDLMLVCSRLSNPTMAVGVSLTAGSTQWEHGFADDPGGQPPLLFNGYLYGRTDGRAFVLDTSSGNVIAGGSYNQPVAVNQTGMVFSISDADGFSWQCWWAPAVG